MKNKWSKKYNIEIIYDGMSETGMHTPIRKFLCQEEIENKLMTPKQIEHAMERLQQRINKIVHKHEKEIIKKYGDFDRYERLSRSR